MLSRVQNIYLCALVLLIINFYPSTSQAVDFKPVGPPFINMKSLSGENLANVTGLIQDRHGYHWLINETGLLRFDGNEFKLFPGLEKFTASKQASVTEGEDGRLWITSLDYGLAMFDTNIERLTFYDLFDTFNIENKADGSPATIGMFSYHRKHLYLATDDTIVKIDEKSLVVAQQFIVPVDGGARIANFLVASNGDIWVSLEQGNGVYLIEPKGLTNFEHDPNNNSSISSSYVTNIYEDSQNRLWFGGIAGLDQYIPSTRTFSRYTPFDLSDQVNKNKNALSNFVLSISQGNDRFLWLTLLREGVFKFDPQTSKFEHFSHRKGISTTIETDAMHAGAIFDTQNTLWISTTKGLSKLPSPHQSLSQLANIDNDMCKALALYESNSGLLFACNKTLFKWDAKNVSVIAHFDEKIISIVQGSDGYIWIGSIGGGVYRYNPVKGTTKNYVFTSDVKQTMGANIPHKIRYDANGELYGIAHEHPTEKGSGIIHYNRELDTFSNFPAEMVLSGWLDVNSDKLVLISAYSTVPEQLAWFDKNNQQIQKLPIKTGAVLAIIKRANQLWVVPKG